MFRPFGEHAGFNPDKLPPSTRRKKDKSPDIIPADVVEKAAKVAMVQAKHDEVEWKRLQEYRDSLTQTKVSEPKLAKPAEMATEKPRLTRPAGAPSTQDLLADVRRDHYAPPGAKRGKVVAQELVAELLSEQPASDMPKKIRKRPDSLAETRPIPPQDSSKLRILMQHPEIDQNMIDTVPAVRVDAPLPPRPDSDTVETNQLSAKEVHKTDIIASSEDNDAFHPDQDIEIPDVDYRDFDLTDTDSRNNPVVAKPNKPEAMEAERIEDIDVEHYLFPEIEPMPDTKRAQTSPTAKKGFGSLFGNLLPKRQSGLKMDSATTYYPPNYRLQVEEPAKPQINQPSVARVDNVIQFPTKQNKPTPEDFSGRWEKIKQELAEPRESGWKKLLSPFLPKRQSGLNLEATVYHPDTDEKRDRDAAE